MRWLGHVAAMTAISILFILFLGGILLAAQQIVAKLPAYESSLENVMGWFWTVSDMPNAISEDSGVVSGRAIDWAVGLASGLLQSISHLAGILSLIFFLVLLMLVEAPANAAKLEIITGREDGQAYRNTLYNIARRIRWYLAIRTLLGVGNGILYFMWSWFWNVDFALVWGLLAFLLSYVPTVGSLLSGILPVAFAAMQLEPLETVAFGSGILLIEQVMGNYVDPKLQGKELSMSPVVIMAALMIWTWTWGIAGALLAVPMTLVFLIIFAGTPGLQPLALLLSNHNDIDELRTALGFGRQGSDA